MFSHVARELGAHSCIGSRASISTETNCRSIETEGA
jgi:hypothetical protein